MYRVSLGLQDGKVAKNLCLSMEVFLMVEKDPFGVCYDRYSSAALG